MQGLDRYKGKFSVTGNKSEEWGDYVQKTAKLIKRPFYATHSMVESWTLSKLKERYHEAEKVEGMPRDVWWFWRRKCDKLKANEKN